MRRTFECTEVIYAAATSRVCDHMLFLDAHYFIITINKTITMFIELDFNIKSDLFAMLYVHFGNYYRLIIRDTFS